MYKEFLTLNFSFVNTKTTGDVKLPSGFKIPDEVSLEKIHAKIQEVISTGELLEMLPLLDLVYEG